MVTKNIILNKKDKEIIEELKLKYGKIVNTDQLKSSFTKKYSDQETMDRISLLSRNGWLVRIKRGLYIVITDIRSIFNIDISEYYIAQKLNSDSYISFENALKHHGLFNQMLKSISSVTYKRARKYSIKSFPINFIKFKKELYFGFSEHDYDAGTVNIAEKEKAALDMIYIRSDDYTINLIWEILSKNKKTINFNKVINYAKKINDTVVRKTGFFLDKLKIDSEDLYTTVKGKGSYSKLTNSSKEFNAKWRLYVDNSLIG